MAASSSVISPRITATKLPAPRTLPASALTDFSPVRSSSTSTSLPCCASAAARLITVVVQPAPIDPPVTAITREPLRARRRRSPSA
ncbi:hypothetical protein ABIE53_000110 [Burkholderia sp. OAS925]